MGRDLGAGRQLIRQLAPGDEALLEAFLLPRIRSSFILAANVADAGLTYNGNPYEGLYAGAFANGELCGVAAHYWNDHVMLQAPTAAAELALAVVQYSARPVSGFLGPWDQVRAARGAFGLSTQPTQYDSEEILYELELEALRIPAQIEDGTFVCRYGELADVASLVELSVAENEEIFNEVDSPELRDRLRQRIERAAYERNVFLLEDGPEPTAISFFQGRVYERVQVGGVYTAPDHRRRGCARSIVAGSLMLARENGIHTATLFTGVDNVAAQRAYENIGFRPVGDYGIVLFERST